MKAKRCGCDIMDLILFIIVVVIVGIMISIIALQRDSIRILENKCKSLEMEMRILYNTLEIDRGKIDIHSPQIERS